jgi:acetylornithine deacetylase/succinyl-diaminopimelate desuccinylase-like protein
MPLLSRNSAFSRVTAIAAKRPVHSAFSWLHINPKTIMDWQADLVVIPAPPFGEQDRSAWIAERFTEAGLVDVETDGVGNVLGFLATPHISPESSGPIVVISAHLDTVFPIETPLRAVRTHIEGIERLEAPGACDNGAGVVGMLALAHALGHAKIELPVPLLFIGNVGEEGEGDLRGMRHLYAQKLLADRIAAHIVLDGAGADATR